MDSERQSITAFASSTSAAKHTITKLYNYGNTLVHAVTCLVLVMCLLIEYIEECAMPHVPTHKCGQCRWKEKCPSQPSCES